MTPPTAELVMDQRIVWDRNSMKQVDEAKAKFRKFRAKGHEILTAAGDILERFNPHIEEFVVKAAKNAKRTMKILCDKGDDRIVWDKENGRQAKEAKAKFEELVGKGYKAYSVDSKSRKNRRIHEFDVDAEEILMTPPTTKG